MRSILLSREFLDAGRAGTKAKRPLHFGASLARATGLDLDYVIDPNASQPITMLDALLFYMQLLGEPLLQARPPTGYPDDSEYWASGGSLVTRFKLISLISGADAVVGVDWGATHGNEDVIVRDVGQRLMPGGVSDTTRAAAQSHLAGFPLALDDMRIREAGALLLSSPDFMRH
jgi:uncharacterized protein (DUF1800 family)